MLTTAAIYARVSSARQKEEQTIVSPTETLRAYAAAEGLDVPSDWVFEDEGFSGAPLIRPGLERLRDRAAEIEIPVVLCHAPDRLARRYAYQALLIEEFARVGTEVRFIKGPKAKTPEDELWLQFQGMIAEYERAQSESSSEHAGASSTARVLDRQPCCLVLPTAIALCGRARRPKPGTHLWNERQWSFASCFDATSKRTSRLLDSPVGSLSKGL